jgi:hypothetical protein
MPLPPPDHPDTVRSARNPARVLLDSPLAAASRAKVYRRTRRPMRERALRIFSMVGTILVHLLFLIVFVFGPPYELPPPRELPLLPVQVRLIETPPPPPLPPPVRGTPPRQIGPRHQGHATRAVANAEHSANVESSEASSPPASSPPTPTLAQAAKPKAPARKGPAAPKPPVSLPHPAPTPTLQPVPLSGEPPTVSLPTPTVQAPVPPKFQPESVRRPQLEGNRPMPPPASLALPELPPQSPPPIAAPSIALNTEVPKTSAPASVTPARPQQPAAPPVPDLQAVPLPAQPSPTVNLQTQLSPPAPSVPREMPQLQAPAIEVAEAQLEALPLASNDAPRVESHAPTVKIDVADKSPRTDVQPSIQRPQLSAPDSTAASASSPKSSPSDASTRSAATDAASKPAVSNSASRPGTTDSGRDVSTAPDATPQGSDNATPGEPEGALAPSGQQSSQANGQPSKAGQGSNKGTAGKNPPGGQPGGNQPGAEQGATHGQPGSYVQLKPTGDTNIMAHGVPNIGYKATRFDQDWTPEGESSVDTALRHAVEKTTVKHTFHLPRGIRVECAVMPLLPMSLLGCHNPDPPPKPVDPKVYERMHLAPASPLAPPAPAASSAPAPMIKVDNSAECAAARVAGGPPPPGCEGILLPVKPASSSSSWVPASDQFH